MFVFFHNCDKSVPKIKTNLNSRFAGNSEGEDVAVSLTEMCQVTFVHFVNLKGPDVLYYYIFL